jgi:hypothetical protein
MKARANHTESEKTKGKRTSMPSSTRRRLTSNGPSLLRGPSQRGRCREQVDARVDATPSVKGVDVKAGGEGTCSLVSCAYGWEGIVGFGVERGDERKGK